MGSEALYPGAHHAAIKYLEGEVERLRIAFARIVRHTKLHEGDRDYPGGPHFALYAAEVAEEALKGRSAT